MEYKKMQNKFERILASRNLIRNTIFYSNETQNIFISILLNSQIYTKNEHTVLKSK